MENQKDVEPEQEISAVKPLEQEGFAVGKKAETPEEQLAEIDKKIAEIDEQIISLSSAAEKDENSIFTIRQQLGLYSDAEEVPSIATGRNAIAELQKRKETLERERALVLAENKNEEPVHEEEETSSTPETDPSTPVKNPSF
ncbi:MAG: hypothetical protein WCT49_02565 [Candidatus Paceibacterota bacterium]|jgi:hypothetical protein|nr:hypothetical protein [Candidatus Paceibacterota bacterium]